MFDLPDPAFVGAAYLRVLGRPADPQGWLFHVRTLRRGQVSRATVLARLQSSEEAQAGARGRPMAEATAHRALWPAARRQRPSRLARRAAEVLALEGEVFVECAYAWWLGRLPDADELLEGAGLAGQPGGKAALLAALRQRRPGWQRWLGAGPVQAGPQAALPEPPPPAPASAAPSPAAGFSPDPSARVALFTIASRRYRPHVAALMASVREHHPGWSLYLLLADEPHAADPPLPGVVEVPASAIGVPDFDDMTMRYDVLELSTALKPFFFRWLLGNSSLQTLIYLDPDIRVYAPLDPVLEPLEGGAPMVLTPHITAPLDDDGAPGDHTILASGVFNLGFAALRRHPEATAFLDWWARQLRTGARVDFAANLFTDQRWCDMAPAFVPGLVVLRHPGCNVAYWNLAQRDVQPLGDGYRVNGQPLVFFHFSGIDIDAAAEGQLSRHQTRFAPGEPASVQGLLADYRQEVQRLGWRQWRDVAWAWNEVAGTPVPALARALYRHLHATPSAITRPQARDELLRHCAAVNPDAETAPVPTLLKLVHARDPQAARAFDLEDAEGRRALAEWFDSAGVHAPGLIELRRQAGHAASAALPVHG